jgi:hypothetical protein
MSKPIAFLTVTKQVKETTTITAGGTFLTIGQLIDRHLDDLIVNNADSMVVRDISLSFEEASWQQYRESLMGNGFFSTPEPTTNEAEPLAVPTINKAKAKWKPSA